MKSLPTIKQIRTLARTRLFHIEELDLEFSNGTSVQFERLKGSSYGAVLVIPMLDAQTVILIREYAAGMERYELALPKGRIEADEDILAAANRELMEEVGYGANQLEHIATYSLAPGYSSQLTYVVLAQNLYPKQLEGDEPEPIEVMHWSLDALPELVQHDELTEARSIAALYQAREIINRDA